jgi:hypothetical protein
MKCYKCESEWKTDANRSASLTVCPFCQERLTEDNVPKFFDNVKDVLHYIASNKFEVKGKEVSGREILLSDMIVSRFSDKAPTLKDEKELIIIFRDKGALKVLKDAMDSTPSEQGIAIKRAAAMLPKFLQNSEDTFAMLYEFAEALGWDLNLSPPPPPPSTVNVTLIHPTNGSDIDVGLPNNIVLRDVFEQLIDANFLDAGQTYTGILKSTGQRLDNNKTVNKNGIGNNSTIQVKKETTVIVGDPYRFGNYDWRVIDIQNGKALLLSELVITDKPYHQPGGEITWENCTLRRDYLNNEFYNSFSTSDKKRIIETPNCNPDNLWYGIPGGKDTRDKVFLLSLEEVDRYFGDSGDYLSKRRKNWNSHDQKFYASNDGWAFSNSHDSERVAKDANGKAWWWWLRSPGDDSYYAAYVNTDGNVGVSGGGVSVSGVGGGFRPALWLNL